MRKLDTVHLPTKGDETTSGSTGVPVIPVLCGENGVAPKTQEDIGSVRLACSKKALDVSHILFHTPNSNPSSFHWMDAVRSPTTVDAMVYDVFELYTRDDRLVGTVYTVIGEDGSRYVIKSMCEYSTQGISKFMGFLGQATNPTTYNISSTCSTYRRLCQYLQSIYTEPVFSGMGIHHDHCQFRKYSPYWI